MLWLLLEAALRSLLLGAIVGLGLKLTRVRDPRAHMTAWTGVLIASLAMPAMMHWLVVTVPLSAPPLQLVEMIEAAPNALLSPVGNSLGFTVRPAQPERTSPNASNTTPIGAGSYSALQQPRAARINWFTDCDQPLRCGDRRLAAALVPWPCPDLAPRARRRADRNGLVRRSLWQ